MTDTARLTPVAGMLRQWAACVDRLMAVAPTAAIVNETGIVNRGSSTPPERKALRAEARKIVVTWLARDLATLDRERTTPSLDAERLARAMERIDAKIVRYVEQENTDAARKEWALADRWHYLAAGNAEAVEAIRAALRDSQPVASEK